MTGAEAETDLVLVGYEAIFDTGFALPCFAHRWGANECFIAACSTPGDRRGVVVGFEHYEPGQLQPLPSDQQRRVAVGAPWCDVFLLEGRSFVGTESELWVKLRPIAEEIVALAPLCLVDAVPVSQKMELVSYAQSAFAHITNHFDPRRADRWFSGVFLQNYIRNRIREHGGQGGEVAPVFVHMDAGQKITIELPQQLADESCIPPDLLDDVSGLSNAFFRRPVKRPRTMSSAAFTATQMLERTWTRLVDSFSRNEPVEGMIDGRVKGGFTVDLGGASAFLPGSQVDIRPVRDITPLMGKRQPFVLLKVDRPRRTVVVSRKAIIERARAEERSRLAGEIQEGEVCEGVVKNLTDYGAFVDLGGIDGLLHVTDMSWRRVSHPSQILAVGDTVKVQIVRINPDTLRISLGMKQLQSDPWVGVEAKYPVGAKFTGRVTNVTDYGAFVELEAGVEGLVHVSEMSWTRINVHTGKLVSPAQEVTVVILDVDSRRRRISLSLRQATPNPWEQFLVNHPIGSIIEGEVRNATEFGLFIGLDGEILGLVHLSDLDWRLPGEEAWMRYRRGDIVKARVLDVDVEKERISLGIKQLADDPLDQDLFRRGQTVTCTVTEITSGGIEVQLGAGDTRIAAFIRKSDLSRDRQEQRPERFAVGDRVDAQVTTVDKAARRVSVSIKALEMADEKEAIEQYGSSDSGASLGDILGAALREKAQKD